MPVRVGRVARVNACVASGLEKSVMVNRGLASVTPKIASAVRAVPAGAFVINGLARLAMAPTVITDASAMVVHARRVVVASAFAANGKGCDAGALLMTALRQAAMSYTQKLCIG